MLTLYGIVQCDTVKKARRWLDGQQIPYRFHDFRKDGLDARQLRSWLEDLGWQVLLNRRSTTWRGLSESERADPDAAAVLVLMLRYPTLIKRPVLVAEDRVLVGFDEQRYQEITGTRCGEE